MSVIALHALRYRWPGAASDCLRIDALDIAAGETVFIHGPSGSGKTTLLSLLTGINLAQHGQVSLLGRDWRSLGAAARDRFRVDHIGYVFQQFNLLPYLSVLENVALPCRFSPRRRARAGDVTSAAQQLLTRLDLADPALWRKPAQVLSVGQQQRVAAARALIGQPEIIIADEPTSALDEPLRDRFIALLLEACAAAQITLLFVSHDQRLRPRFSRLIDLPALNQAQQPGEAGHA